MMLRSVKLYTRPVSRALVISRPSFKQFGRFNSSKTTPPPPSPPPPPPSGNIKGKVLLAVGVLAIGSTFASSLLTKDSPKSAIEPTKKVEPQFADGKISVVFVLGGPGAGKGTQCAKLVKEQGFVHLSAGDLLRAEQNRQGSTFGELIAKCIKEGTIVPQEVTLALLKQAIVEENLKGATKFLVDGFPRKMDQALSFEEQIAKSSFTLFFECPEQVMLERLLERGKTSGRTDDNIESIKKRFRTFIETSMPVVEYFEQQNRVVKVRCDLAVEDVYSKVKEALSSRGI